MPAQKGHDNKPEPAGVALEEASGPPLVVAAPKTVSGFSFISAFFKDDHDEASFRPDERDYYPRHKKILAQVKRQSIIIGVLAVLLLVLGPFLKPLHIHQAIYDTPEQQRESLVALTEPNLTDDAILSWATTSITEILTFGFGDFDKRILSQRNRFTDEGWASFVNVLLKRGWQENFKSNQLVLTTVPSDEPVIVSKGLDEDMDYIWIVEMPIVMTFATNNNVSRAENHLVRLVIRRVPAKDNVVGIGIKSWHMM